MYNDASNLTVTNCTFNGNSANVIGGGMFNVASNLTLTNCTFSENSATDGGGLYMIGSSSVVTTANCILWGNTAPTGPELTVLGGSTLTISFSDVEGGIGAINGEAGITVNYGAGMIETDPLFFGGPSGVWAANGVFDTATGQVTVEDTTASFIDGDLVGKFVNPNTTQSLQFIIIANTATTMTCKDCI